MGASIIDIKSVDINSIDKNEVFAIDTNVLVWTHYSKASDPSLNRHPYQVIEYPNFVARLLNNGNKLITTVLNITELCGVIEKNQYRIYKAANSCGTLKFKDYRNNASERAIYKNEINNMIMEIKGAYDNQIEIIDITEEKVNAFMSNICNSKCDIFDYVVIEYLKSIGVNNYISDDKDFSSVDGIKLFTTYE